METTNPEIRMFLKLPIQKGYIRYKQVYLQTRIDEIILKRRKSCAMKNWKNKKRELEIFKS